MTDEKFTEEQALGLIIVSLPLWVVSYVLFHGALAAGVGFIGGALLAVALGVGPGVTAVGLHAFRRERSA